MTPQVPEDKHKRALILLLLLLPLPSLGVWLSMGVPSLRGSALGQALYLSAKFLFYAVPLLLFFMDRKSLKILWPATKVHLKTGVFWGFILSFAVALAALVISLLNVNLLSIRQAAIENGLGSWGKFLVLTLYLSILNSFMEEFVWRVFLFQQCRLILSKATAVVFVNLAFSAHHFLALVYQTDFSNALFGTIAVFLAGCLWSVLLIRYKSIWPAYLSHMCVDFAIFAWAGWIIFG